MSAFVCSEEHFKALALFATSRDGSRRFKIDPRLILQGYIEATPNRRGLASIYADILYQENIRSVRERYPEDAWEEIPGPIIKPLHIIVCWKDEDCGAMRLNPVAILKLCDSLQYQSCETENYEQTTAYKLLHAIRQAAIRALPGYDGAPWAFTLSEQSAA